ncbi:DNA repair protein RadC [Pseudomonas alkylphenolica]|uniref:DNA repair protein RadC n=2 Tax=Pseudomonas alkylphenolica TaxID=237609 RepID=A0A077FGE5_9PSED|nr:DNA repair protein RadC [Pseudomonas alkylphenolica]
MDREVRMSIRDWPAAERPREKLLERGAASLSDAELLAVFLRTGVAGKSAVDLARHLLEKFGGLRQLLEADMPIFLAEMGLGPAKYTQLQAVMEIGRRHLAETIARDSVIQSPRAVRRYLKSMLRHEQSEAFGCLFLDTKHRPLGFEVLFRGTIDSASVYPREVVRRSLAKNAAALILCHNHPSGIPEPSQADLHMTLRLKDALSLVEVRVLDHIIVGDGEPLSMVEQGWFAA